MVSRLPIELVYPIDLLGNLGYGRCKATTGIVWITVDVDQQLAFSRCSQTRSETSPSRNWTATNSRSHKFGNFVFEIVDFSVVLHVARVIWRMILFSSNFVKLVV